MIEMVVKGLTLDPLTNMPIVILNDLNGQKALPIWVGIFEANAIALEIEKIPTPRPMTHDLIKNILDGVNAKVEKVIVNDLKNNTFYANILLKMNKREVIIDSRPSDAIAVALRTKAPIFVSAKVLEQAKGIDLSGQKSAPETEEFKNWLDNLKPGDFGSIEG